MTDVGEEKKDNIQVYRAYRKEYDKAVNEQIKSIIKLKEDSLKANPNWKAMTIYYDELKNRQRSCWRCVWGWNLLLTLATVCLTVNTMLLYEKKLYDQLNDMGTDWTDLVNWSLGVNSAQVAFSFLLCLNGGSPWIRKTVLVLYVFLWLVTLWCIRISFRASNLNCDTVGLPALNSIGQKSECEIWDTLSTNVLLIVWVQFVQMLYLTFVVITFECAWCRRKSKYKLSAVDQDQLIHNVIDSIKSREQLYKKPLTHDELTNDNTAGQTYVCANCQTDLENDIKIVQLPTSPLCRFHTDCLYYELEFQAKSYKQSPNLCPITQKPIFVLNKGQEGSWAWPNQKDDFEMHYAPDNWAVAGGVTNMGCCDKIGDIVIDIAGGKGNEKDFGGGHEAFEGDNDEEDEEQ